MRKREKKGEIERVRKSARDKEKQRVRERE